MYFFIHCSEDGDISVTQYNKEELLEIIKEYGDIKYFEKLEEEDPQCWGRNALIIKGEIATPKPKKVVEEYEI